MKQLWTCDQKKQHLSQTGELEELLNSIVAVYVRVGQFDLEISEAVEWAKILHEAMWRCSPA